MTKALYALSLLTIALGGVALALWLMPAPDLPHEQAIRRYGVHEGLQLAYMADGHGGGHFAVEDGSGRLLYDIPLRGCLLDVRFRDGRLRFRESSTGREGYIDRSGTVTFLPTDGHTPQPQEHRGMAKQATATGNAAATTAADGKPAEGDGRMADAADLRRMARSNPFYAEASKILSGKLSVEDAGRRRTILGYCEHLRTAYTTKDIDFLRQVFSDEALIIVGNVVRTAPGSDKAGLPRQRVEYFMRTKKEYLARLERAFAASKAIDVKFSGFSIMRHPTMDGIYGVSLRQRYKSDRYADDGYLFLLWDFRNPSMPLIHVRTWQPYDSAGDGDGMVSISDFNLQ